MMGSVLTPGGGGGPINGAMFNGPSAREFALGFTARLTTGTRTLA